MNNKNYFIVYDWMFNLDIKGYELLIFALIYSYGEYYGSQQAIADRLHTTRKYVNLYIKKLLHKGYIIQQDYKYHSGYSHFTVNNAIVNKCQNNYEKKHKNEKGTITDIPQYRDLHSNEEINQQEIDEFFKNLS